ncbi:hypothetical protein Aperf_G00000114656 [Anoplocephala perfoliata]
MPSRGKYDMLGNLITTTSTTGVPVTTTTVSTIPPTTTTTTTTTTPLPMMVPAETAEALNVFERHPTATDFLRNLAPAAVDVDRSMTVFCLPIEALGLVLTAAVLLSWSQNQRYSRWNESRRRDNLLRLIGILYCPLLLLQVTTSFLIDLDGVWELRILASAGARALCPLIHSLEISTKVAISLTLLLIAWRTHKLTSKNANFTPSRDAFCKFPCGSFPAYVGILLLSFIAGLVGVNFWQVAAVPQAGAPNEIQLVCAPREGYKSGFRVNFQKDAPSILLYEWIVNMAVFAPTTFIAVVCAMIFSRRLLRLPPSQMHDAPTLREDCIIRFQQHRLKLVIVICGLYGFVNLPLVSAVFLGVMAVPGSPDLPDHEILSDPVWVQALRHVFAIILCREIAEAVIAALLFPVLITTSSAFRLHFLTLLRINSSADYQHSSRKTLTSRAANACSHLGRMCGFAPREPPQESDREAAKAPLRWSWGKGWRQSYSLPTSSPPPMSEREDPEYLDSLIRQHNNAFAAATVSDASRSPNYYL